MPIPGFSNSLGMIDRLRQDPFAGEAPLKSHTNSTKTWISVLLRRSPNSHNGVFPLEHQPRTTKSTNKGEEVGGGRSIGKGKRMRRDLLLFNFLHAAPRISSLGGRRCRPLWCWWSSRRDATRCKDQIRPRGYQSRPDAWRSHLRNFPPPLLAEKASGGGRKK